MTLNIDVFTKEERMQLLRELSEARYSGTKRVKFDDRDIEFKSDAEMRSAISDLEASLKPRRGPLVTIQTTFSSGL